MKTHQNQKVQKLFNARLQFLNLISYFLFISCFLTLGVIVVFYSKSLSFNLHVTQFSISHSRFNFSPPTPKPPPPPPPPPAPLHNKTVRETETEPEIVVGLKDHHDHTKPPSDFMHSMDDAELLLMASRTPRNNYSENNIALLTDGVPKVAFMFLTKGSVLLAPLWEKFFYGHEGLYSIYVHSDPSFNESEPQSSVFHGRRIPSKEVGWGQVNMIEAERRLLANALLDSLNERFVLLSESCIPLFNFSTIYSYLMNSNQTFVESYDLPGPVGRGRYTHLMRPEVTLQQWRKGSQWFQIDRDLAMEVVTDRKYFSVFEKYCRVKCYSDEHYLPTYVHIKLGERNSNRTLTWVDWSKGGPHPGRFMRQHVTYEFLEWLRSGTTCEYNGKTTNICHLFARKFTSHALDRLLRFSPKIMHFDS